LTYLALLRAVNLLGYNRVAMADLRELLARMGFTEPRTLLQSGNVVFRGRARSAARLERQLETEAEKSLGIRADFMVRTTEEWKGVIAGNPFRTEAARDPAHLLVMFLKHAPEAGAVEALRSAMRGPEWVDVEGRHAYFVYPEGIGRSKVTTALIERKLGTRGTGRNWNTVLKLGALAGTGSPT
jgi:uncharacterized protein (DUF1697 family)